LKLSIEIKKVSLGIPFSIRGGLTMCTILVAYKAHNEYDLILASNRDEFYERPTKEAHYWQTHKGVLGGRDLKACGMWLGVHESGRMGALTNFRDFRLPHGDKTTRGEIVLNYLTSKLDHTAYMNALVLNKDVYDPYNALLYDGDQLSYFNNITCTYHLVEQGVHGLSNRFLDTPWFKVRQGRAQLKSLIDEQNKINPDDLFSLLKRCDRAEDIELPDTGIGLKWERVLSSIFIKDEDYGTRYSTVVLVHKNGDIEFIERYYDHTKDSWKQHAFKV